MILPTRASAKIDPNVSVIIPYYNTAQYVAETLKSLLAQTYTDYEVILVNDGSPDTERLEKILESYGDRINYIKQENKGSSAARNTALKIARGKYVALLDSDDLWEPDYLETQVGVLDRNPQIDVIFPDALFFGDSINTGKTFMDVCRVSGEITFLRLITQQCHVFVGVTARRETVLRAGMFDESLGSAEDLDLWFRILHQGGRIAYHKKVLAHYRQRAGSHTSDPLWLIRNNLKLLDKVQTTMNLNAQELEVIANHKMKFLAAQHLHEGKKAFFRGDTKRAIDSLSTANRYYRSAKLTLMLGFLRMAPRLLLRAYDLRDRFVFRANTKF